MNDPETPQEQEPVGEAELQDPTSDDTVDLPAEEAETPEESPSEAESSAGLTTLLAAIDKLGTRFDDLEGSLTKIQRRSDDLARAVARVSQTQNLASDQVRSLSERIDEAAQGVADGRFLELTQELFAHWDQIRTFAESNCPPDEAGRWTMVSGQVDQMLSAHGIERFEVGDKVNHNLHQPIERVEAESPEQDQKVVRVVRPGYRLGDRILRHADVIVAVWDSTQDADSEVQDVTSDEPSTDTETQAAEPSADSGDAPA